MNGLEEAGAGEVRQTACIVAVGLVRRQRLQRLIGTRRTALLARFLSANPA
jgi:hypothetical protein